MNNEFPENLSASMEKIKSIDFGKILLLLLLIVVIVYMAIEYYDSINREGDFKIEDTQMFVLQSSNSLYDRIELNMSKEEILTLIEELPISTLYFADDNNVGYHISFNDNKSEYISRDIYSSEYENIQLSVELETEIEDLTKVVNKINEDMTLADVESILGDKYIETRKQSDGSYTYEWYDKLENYVSIYFSEDDKVDYVSSVRGAY